MILKQVTQHTKPNNIGPLAPICEGPYRIREMLCPETCILESPTGQQNATPMECRTPKALLLIICLLFIYYFDYFGYIVLSFFRANEISKAYA